MKKKSLLIPLITLIIIILIVAAFTLFNVQNRNWKSGPDIWGDKVIWYDEENIWLYNITSKSTKKIVTGEDFIFRAKISHNRVIYYGSPERVHQAEDKVTFKIIDYNNDSKYNLISKNYVSEFELFKDYLVTQESNKIVIYSLKNGYIKSLDYKDGDISKQVVNVNDNYVIWWDNHGVTMKIYSFQSQNISNFDLSTKESYATSGRLGGHYIITPGIYNSNIAYVAMIDEKYYQNDLYVFSITDHKVHQISNDSLFEFDSEIYENDIVWSVKGDNKPKIFHSNLSNPLPSLFYESDRGINNVRIYEKYVVWREAKDPKYDIMLGDLETKEVIKIS